MEGYIYKWISYFTGWTKYYFVLENETLSYYTDKESFLEDDSKNLIGTLNITRTETEIDVDQFGNTATITDTNSGQATFIQFLNYNDKRDWLKHIGTARAGKLTGKISVSESSSESTTESSSNSSKDSSSKDSSSKESSKSDFKIKVDDIQEEVTATISSEIKEDVNETTEKIETTIDNVNINDANVDNIEDTEKDDNLPKIENEEIIIDQDSVSENIKLEISGNVEILKEDVKEEPVKEEIPKEDVKEEPVNQEIPKEDVKEEPVNQEIPKEDVKDSLEDINNVKEEKTIEIDQENVDKHETVSIDQDIRDIDEQIEDVNKLDDSINEPKAETTQLNDTVDKISSETIETDNQNNDNQENKSELNEDTIDSSKSETESEEPVTPVTDASDLIEKIQTNLEKFNEKLQNFNSLFVEGGELASVDEFKIKSNECNNLILSVNEQISQLAIANKQIQDVVSENIFERLKQVGNSIDVVSITSEKSIQTLISTNLSTEFSQQNLQHIDQFSVNSKNSSEKIEDKVEISDIEISESESLNQESEMQNTTVQGDGSISFFSSRPVNFSHVTVSEDDNKFIDLNSFLQACSYFAEVYDLLGSTTFSPLKADVMGNVNKLKGKGELYKLTTVQELVMHEIQNKTISVKGSATDALVWLKRGLWLFCKFLTNVINGQRDPSKAFGEAYNNSLAKHHNFVVRKLFNVGLMAFPDWTVLNKKFLTQHDMLEGDSEKVLIDHIGEYIKYMEPHLVTLDKFYDGNGLAN